MTDGLPNPDPGAQLPSQVTAILNLLLTHNLTTVAGLMVGIGALAPNQSAQFVTIASGLILWAAPQVYAVVIQHLRHKQAVVAMAQAKAS